MSRTDHSDAGDQRASDDHCAAGLPVETPSGRVVDLLDPDPATISIDDIAHALAMLCRFAGNVRRFWSVADHALLCRELVCEACHAGLALAALHHDSHEALIGDITVPVAQLLDRGTLGQVRRRLDEAIGTALGIDPDQFTHPIVVDADRAAVHLEARALQHRRGRCSHHRQCGASPRGPSSATGLGWPSGAFSPRTAATPMRPDPHRANPEARARALPAVRASPARHRGPTSNPTARPRPRGPRDARFRRRVGLPNLTRCQP
jgi:uncharacterized protein